MHEEFNRTSRRDLSETLYNVIKQKCLREAGAAKLTAGVHTTESSIQGMKATVWITVDEDGDIVSGSFQWL